MPNGQQPKPRVGRREGPLAGISPQQDALAAWLRQITAGLTLDQLVAEFNTYQRATWGEFRNGRKPIPLPLLRKVVTCLITEPSRQVGELERGRELFRAAASAAASAAAAKDRAVASGGAGLSVRELQIRLDDARRGHIEVQQALLDNLSTIRVLEATITSLEERCARLETERDQALGQARSVAAVQLDLEAFTRTLAQAEERLELAFHDRTSAELLLADVRRQAQNYRRALHALNQNAPSGADQHDTASDEAPGDDPRTSADHQQPQQWEYEALLETVDWRRTAHHKQLADVRRRLEIQAPKDEESVAVIEGALGVVQALSLDNPDNAPTSNESRLETPRGDADQPGWAAAEPTTAAAVPSFSVTASPTRRLTASRVLGLPGRPAGAHGSLPSSSDGVAVDGVGRERMSWTQRGGRALRNRQMRAAATVLLLALTATTAAPPSRTSSASHNRHAASHRVTAVEQAPPVRWTATFPYGAHLDAVTRDSWFLQDSDTIRAVDIATGTTRWRVPSPVVATAMRGLVAADDHAIYAARDTVVQARDSSTGSFRWERNLSILRPTSADPDLFGVISTRLSRTSDVLYVVMWAGSTQRVTAALRTRTGAVLWHTESELLNEIGSTCLMSSDTQTQDVDCLSGIPQWKADQTAQTAVTIGSAIMAVCDNEGRIRSFNALTGRQLWETASPYPKPLTTLQAANGLIYFTDYNGRLYALDAATGTPRWSAPTDLTRKTPAIDRDHVYATGLDKHLYAFDATTGARVWAAPTGDYITADPQVVENTVYAAGKDGRLHAINRTNGTHRWTTPASDTAITYLNATADHITTLTDPNTREQADPIAQQR